MHQIGAPQQFGHRGQDQRSAHLAGDGGERLAPRLLPSPGCLCTLRWFPAAKKGLDNGIGLWEDGRGAHGPPGPPARTDMRGRGLT